MAELTKKRALRYRPLRWRDWSFCRQLASDPDVRSMSLDPQAPGLLRHAWWMYCQMTDRRRLARVISVGRAEKPVGLVRALALARGGAELSIALLPSARGLGFGRRALIDLTPHIARYYGGPVYARVKPENAHSHAAFTAAGYETVDWDWFIPNWMTLDEAIDLVRPQTLVELAPTIGIIILRWKPNAI